MKKKVIGNYQSMFPMHLQFFAEDTGASATDSTQPSESIDEAGGTEEKPSEKSYEDALAEIAQAQAEVKKLKAERDAALKKSGEVSKQLRAKMSEDEIKAEQAAQEKEEHDAYVKELESFRNRTLAKERYILQGMDGELASKAAEAEIKGDMDELASIQASFTKKLIKAKEDEWKASRPRVNMGDGEETSMTKEEILAIVDRDKRQEEIAKHLDLFQ